MEAFLDSQPLDCPASCTLEEVLNVARPLADARGRLIVEVRIDGQAISGESLDQRLPLPLNDEQVELLSAHPVALATTALDDALDALAQTRHIQKTAAEKLITDQAAQAMPQIRELMTTWQQLHLILHQTLQLCGEDSIRDPARLQKSIRRLAAVLNGVRDQLAAANWLGLADIFNFEMEETIACWETLLGDLRQTLRDRLAAGDTGDPA